MKDKSRFSTLGNDAAGVGLIILSALTGWLPGPGGIPLFFAGLNRLAVNHEKPRRLQDYLVKNGVGFLERVFPDRKLIAFLWDMLSAILLGIALFTFFEFETAVRYTYIVSLTATGLFVFAYNRRRYDRAKGKFSKKN